jgi:hypothetical protein
MRIKYWRRSKSPAIRAGLIFDDRGNPMNPGHANNNAVRYRYYTSQAVLQNRKAEARFGSPRLGSGCRKRNLQISPANGGANEEVSDRDLIRQHFERIVIHLSWIAISLRPGRARNGTATAAARQRHPLLGSRGPRSAARGAFELRRAGPRGHGGLGGAPLAALPETASRVPAEIANSICR